MTTLRQSLDLSRLLQFVSIYGLLLLLVILVIAFSLLRPETFPTAFNARTILNDKAVVALLALGVMIPLAANQFDLSIGWNVGLTHILVIGFQANSGLPWWLAVVATIFIAALVGLVNGLLVTRAQISSFIATLGTGTVLFGISNWYTGGRQVLGALEEPFRAITAAPGGLPLSAVYVLIIAIGLWIAFEYTPVGRFLYVIGSNRRAAELTGISVGRYVTLAFVASAVLASIAGIILGSRLRVGQASVGPELLLPAFAGALLGATAIRPGRVNVWGTITAVLVLAVAVAGLQQLGAAFYVEPLFNGAMLIVAVALAGYAARRRQRTSLDADRAAAREGSVFPETDGPLPDQRPPPTLRE